VACKVAELREVIDGKMGFLVAEAIDEVGSARVLLFAADVDAVGVLFLADAGAVALHVCDPISEAQQ